MLANGTVALRIDTCWEICLRIVLASRACLIAKTSAPHTQSKFGVVSCLVVDTGADVRRVIRVETLRSSASGSYSSSTEEMVHCRLERAFSESVIIQDATLPMSPLVKAMGRGNRYCKVSRSSSSVEDLPSRARVKKVKRSVSTANREFHAVCIWYWYFLGSVLCSDDETMRPAYMTRPPLSVSAMHEAAHRRFEVHYERLPKSSPYVGFFHRGYTASCKVTKLVSAPPLSP